MDDYLGKSIEDQDGMIFRHDGVLEATVGFGGLRTGQPPARPTDIDDGVVFVESDRTSRVRIHGRGGCWA